MNKIKNAEIALTRQKMFMDHYKSSYMFTAQNLLQFILDSIYYMTPVSEKNIGYLINFLINLKEELIESIHEFIRLVEKLSDEVSDYLIEVKNDLQ